MHLIYRKTCRVCGSSSLTPVINLGSQYLQGSFVKAGHEPPPIRKIECKLVRCNPELDENACGLLQMEKTVPAEILYASYGYKSGVNNTMKLHLDALAFDLQGMVLQNRPKLILDIGANDGTLLGYFARGASNDLYGIDPSDVACEAAVNVPSAKIVQGLYPHGALRVYTGGKKFNIITAIAMFYDLEKPLDFVRAVKEDLNYGGIFCFEMSYMPAMLEMNSYDTIVHEHLEFYSLAVIERILSMSGMKLVRVCFNDINGGSIRCFATHVDCFDYENKQWQQEIRTARKREFDLKLDTNDPYKDFQTRVIALVDKLHGLLLNLKREGKKIHVYGASTKGNVILQFAGIDSLLIDAAADRNPDKWGGKTLGTYIPIISEEESRKMKPDVYLSLIWHFKKEIIEREAEFLARGGKFVFPLPQVEVYPQ
jgi:SAM-dependent methyltransferase